MEDELLLKQLDYICNALNDNNINYYVVGALGAYIDCNLDTVRKHDDIDIMIEEKEIDRLKDLFENTDYIFYDNRKSSNKALNEKGFTEGADHEVYAKYKDSEFHIGFFMYEKEDDKYSIIEYYKDDDTQKRLIRTLPIKYLYYQYDDNYKIYKGIRLKTVRVECIYKNKQNMDREKDKFDNNIFKEYINEAIMNNLSGKSKYRETKIEEIKEKH